MRYPFIEAHRKLFTVRAMCRAMQVARSGYYAWRRRVIIRRALLPREAQRHHLLKKVRRIFLESGKSYGSPRVFRDLLAEGVACSENRVARLMREAGLYAVGKRRFKVTTQASAALPVAQNKLGRSFTMEHLNQAWAADITYVWTREGWLYLAVVMDVASRRIVGWSMKSGLTSELALSALEMAIKQRRPAAGLLHHSDRGSQYASRAYQAALTKMGIVCSMSRKGDCYDNAVVESFFATIKRECIRRYHFTTRSEARSNIFQYIEGWYNRKRRHSTLDYLSPAAYERKLTYSTPTMT